MTGRSRRRLSHTLTGLATLTFPKSRRSDAHVVRDCAREAVDAAGSTRAAARDRVASRGGSAHAGLGLGSVARCCTRPWREGAGPCSCCRSPQRCSWSGPSASSPATTTGRSARVGCSCSAARWVAVVGAALERGRLAAAGAFAVFATAASPYLGVGTVDVTTGHAELLPRLGSGHRGGIASPHPAAYCRRAEPAARADGRCALRTYGWLPAFLSPAVYRGGLPVPRTGARADLQWALVSPGMDRSVVRGEDRARAALPRCRGYRNRKPLLRILGFALARGGRGSPGERSRSRPTWALASGMVLAERGVSAGLGSCSAQTRSSGRPWSGLYNGAYPLLLAAIPLLLALYLMRRAGAG